MQEVRKKPGVLLTSDHFRYHTGRIVTAFCEEWPSDIIAVITRGAEDCPGSKKNSRHFDGKAFDFRARSLPPEIDRNKLLHRVMDKLGRPDYFGYYKENDVTEWFHIQNNK